MGRQKYTFFNTKNMSDAFLKIFSKMLIFWQIKLHGVFRQSIFLHIHKEYISTYLENCHAVCKFSQPKKARFVV